MSNAPQDPVQIPNYTNYQPGEELQKFRRRFAQLMQTGSVTPEMFHQTLMQLWNENERRRQSCLSEAEDHLRKYHALVSQAHAFSAQGSIVYSIINGYVVIEENRAKEEAARLKERAEVEAEAKKLADEQAAGPAGPAGTSTESAPSTLAPSVDESKTNGNGSRRKKS